jgi:hypothetical protein
LERRKRGLCNYACCCWKNSEMTWKATHT